MQPGVDPLRASHTGRDAAGRDHRAVRGASARGALRRSGCQQRLAGRLMREAKGEGVDPQGVCNVAGKMSGFKGIEMLYAVVLTADE